MNKTKKIKESKGFSTLPDYEQAAKDAFDSLFLDAQDLDPSAFCGGLSQLTYLLGRIRRCRPLTRTRPLKKLRFNPNF